MTRWALVLAVLALPASASAQESGDPVSVVEALFDAMRAGDAAAMASLMHEDARLVTTGVAEDGTPVARVLDIARWLDGVGSSQRVLDERLYDTEVRVDQGMASVWTRYDLFVDGAFSHCGVDAFHLVRTADGWRILEIVDTRRREGCREP